MDELTKHVALVTENVPTFGMLIFPDLGVFILAINYKYPLTKELIETINQKFLYHEGPKFISISGLADDPREVWEPREVQKLAADIGVRFPDLILDPNLQQDTITWMTLAELVYYGAEVATTGPMKDARFDPNKVLGKSIKYQIILNDDTFKKLRGQLVEVAKQILQGKSNG